MPSARRFLVFWDRRPPIDLGLERAGMEIRWQVEIDPFCRRVLAKHWPDVPCYEDVRDVGAHNLEPVDLLAAGFPCQDISFCGSGEGLDGERSGLWSDAARIICELRPRFILVENVAALTIRGLGSVLADLARLRYDAEWSVLSACSMGAPHMRRRLFIVAYTNGQHGHPRIRNSVARAFRSVQEIDGFTDSRAGWAARLENPSELYGGADGIADRLDRNRGIGNSVVPKVAEWIGRRIMEAAESSVDGGTADDQPVSEPESVVGPQTKGEGE